MISPDHSDHETRRKRTESQLSSNPFSNQDFFHLQLKITKFQQIKALICNYCKLFPQGFSLSRNFIKTETFFGLREQKKQNFTQRSSNEFHRKGHNLWQAWFLFEKAVIQRSTASIITFPYLSVVTDKYRRTGELAKIYLNCFN